MRDGRGITQRAYEVLQLERLLVHRERERVDGEVAVADGAGDFLAASRGLFRAGNLAHRITGERPDELLFLRLIRVALDCLADLVSHLGAVLVAHVAGQRGVADVEMRFIDDDDGAMRFAFGRIAHDRRIAAACGQNGEGDE